MLVQDSKWRSAWYYSCFGILIPKGKHVEMVRRLLKHVAADRITSEMVLCTVNTRNEGVTWEVLDKLRVDIKSKDSMGNCELVFFDLDILDCPNATMTVFFNVILLSATVFLHRRYCVFIIFQFKMFLFPRLISGRDGIFAK